MKHPIQLSFLKKEISFGGSLLKGANAREPRPISTKNFLHVVLKSEIAKKSETQDLRLTSKRSQVMKILKAKLHDHGIRIHSLAIASNHIHLLISVKSRRKYCQWIRRITGLIARLILNAEKGRASKMSFWTSRPFTRIVFWGRDYTAVTAYLEKNALEAVGFLAYTPRSYPIISSA